MLSTTNHTARINFDFIWSTKGDELGPNLYAEAREFVTISIAPFICNVAEEHRAIHLSLILQDALKFTAESAVNAMRADDDATFEAEPTA